MEIVLAIFGVAWTGGCLFGFGLAIRESIDYSDWGILVLLVTLGTPAALFLAFLPWVAAADIKAEAESPNLATLKKGAWECSHSHPVTNTTYVMSGKVMVPITTTSNVCDQYEAKQ